ncbi:phosphoribosylaminoimidazolesuccinocarboxamide synthase [Methylophilaceae bacterium]|jgi:phosphoribosylaminoimidazole-succinocarboxamide synthase|nr:phosphoribosylaminoimidazolesuccinocarboxamide synthase [Methylophilaceae bacterium]|tara:strand:- start:294 stop:1181 length:888 start_codon:yes stop_codon:yes gene_type:complete
MTTLTQTSLSSLKLLNQGKVRDIYDIDDENILIVTTDRLSAFDVIMNEPIPFKGEVLTKMASFWFEKFNSVIPNHLTHKNPLDFVNKSESDQIINRSIIAKKLNPIPIEVIVRGYIIGSGWKEYVLSNSICGINLPTGLKLAEQLSSPIFTPSSKAEVGNQDENISLKECENLIGKELTSQLNLISLDLYKKAYEFAYNKGIIIADTKFEFGLDNLGKIHIIDEILTPDSSRFWPKESYQLGISPPSFDKQYVRDWLESTSWNKSPPPPALPDDVIHKTSEKYRQAFLKLTGEKI